MSLRPTEPLNNNVADMGKMHFLVVKIPTLPGEWPGQCRMSKVNPPIETYRLHRASGPARNRARRSCRTARRWLPHCRAGTCRRCAAFDRHFQRVAQLGGAADMVDMTVGQPDFFPPSQLDCAIAPEFSERRRRVSIIPDAVLSGTAPDLVRGYKRPW